MYSHLIDLLYSFSLPQVVPSFTHESPRGSRTLIDLTCLLANPRVREKYQNKVSSMLQSAKKQYFKSLAILLTLRSSENSQLLNHAQVSMPVLCAEGVSAATDIGRELSWYVEQLFC